jgi:hypothetical protein
VLPTDQNAVSYETADVDGIPVVWIQPGKQHGDARIALWLPWLTGTKETALPFLAGLAGRGFTAVSFDLWQHGKRGTETGEQIGARVFGGFRRHMWPILGQTTLDALRITDWAAGEFGAGDVAAGGCQRAVTSRWRSPGSISGSAGWRQLWPRLTGPGRACGTSVTRRGSCRKADPMRARGGSTTVLTRCPTSVTTRTGPPSPSNAAPTTRTSGRRGRCDSATHWRRPTRRPARASA